MAVVSYEKRENVYSKPIVDVGSLEWKRRELIRAGSLQYGRRGETNYYAMIALFDQDLIDYHKREHLSVKGNSYASIINDLYNLVFNN
jgi:hypothetical protein